MRPDKAHSFVGGVVVNALVFEFMGLAMLGLVVVVLAIPSVRERSRGVRYY